MLKILSVNNKEEENILRQKSEEVDLKKIKSKEIQNIVLELFEFSASQGDSAGISAVQLGFLKRIFIVEPKILEKITEKKVEKKDCIFINPKITKHSRKTIESEEGCLSVRWKYGIVNRFKNVTIEYYNLKGEKKNRGAGDFLAAIFQHELDHLNGVLFTDKAKNIKELSDKEIEKLKKNNK